MLEESAMTEAATHTPGPWSVSETENVVIANEADDGSYEEIADCDRGGDSEEAYSNARLIAAAPDLLAVVREIAILGHGKCTIGKPLAYMARAALAKAETR